MITVASSENLSEKTAQKVVTKIQPLAMKELATILGVSRVAILKRAERESWPCEAVSTNGGMQKLFRVHDLPPDIKKMVRIHFGEIPEELAECIPVSFDATRIARCSREWDAARPWQRELAQNRREVLETLDRFRAEFQGGRREAVDTFVELFRAKDVPGLDPMLYERVGRMSKSQVYFWLKQYAGEGIAGLIARYGKTRGYSTVPVDQQQFVLGIMSKNPHLKPTRVAQSVQARFNGDAAGRRAVERFVRAAKAADPAAFALNESPDGYKGKYQLALGNAGEKATHFLHYIEMDSSPIDVMCHDNRRYTIIGACDIFSRKMMFQVCKTSNSWGIAGLMRRIAQEWGLPEKVVRDNGQDYASRMVNDALCALGIAVCPTAPFAPEQKPHIERGFGTMTRDLAEVLPGYIGHSVSDRKKINDRTSFADRFCKHKQVIQCGLTWTALQEALDGWTEQVYHQRPHSGIAGASPNARASSVPTRPRRIEDPRVLDILLAPAGERVVGKKGLSYEGGQYWNDELIDHLGCKILVRADVWDAGRVWCFQPADNGFICEAADIVLSGMTVGDKIVAKKRANKRIREKVAAMRTLAKEVGDPLADEIRSIRKRGTVTNLAVGEPVKGNPFVDAAMAAVAKRDEREAEEAQPAPPRARRIFTEPEPMDPKIALFKKRLPTCKEDLVFKNERSRFDYLRHKQRVEDLEEKEIRWVLTNLALPSIQGHIHMFSADWEECDRLWLGSIAPTQFPMFVRNDSTGEIR
jgi:hypothetical protein